MWHVSSEFHVEIEKLARNGFCEQGWLDESSKVFAVAISASQSDDGLEFV